MTATSDVTDTQTTTGRVVRVTGPVVDVEFARGSLPELYNALTVEVALGALAKTLTLEVAQHLGDNLARTISMQPTDGLVRGQAVTDTGGPISVPVGDRAARVSIVDKGASVEIAVDTDGDLSFDLAVATLKTADAITIGQDIFVGL